MTFSLKHAYEHACTDILIRLHSRGLLAMDENSKGSALLAIYWTQFTIALICVGLRIYARRLIHAFGWDDVFILLTMVFSDNPIAFKARFLNKDI